MRRPAPVAVPADRAPRAPPRPRPAVVLAAVLAAVFTVYSNAFDAPFVWDDHLLVEDEPRVQTLDPVAHVAKGFWRAGATRSVSSYYRPVVTWSYALDWRRSGGGPGSFHVTNVAAHLLACALLFALARRGGASPIAAGIAALLFGTLPRLTESVSWVSGRTDPFAAVFTLLALWLHGTSPGRARWRWGAAGALLAGLLCKEVAIAGVVAIAAAEWAAARADGAAPRRALRNLVPAATAVVAYAALRAAVGGAALGATVQPELVRPLAVVQAIGQYTLMLLDPLRPRIQIGLLGRTEPAVVAVGVAAALAVAALAVRAWRRPPAPAVAAGLALALAAIAPVLHVVPLSLATVAADRFLYLPAAGLALAAAAASRRLGPGAGRAAAAVALALAAAFAVATYRRALDWTDEVRLWTVAVETTPPANPLPRIHLGTALQERGRYEEAIAQFRRALADGAGPFRREALANLGVSLSNLGRLEEASEPLAKAVALGGGLAIDHFNLAVLEARRLRFDAAEAELRATLAAAPGYPDAVAWLAFLPAARQAQAALPPERADEPTGVRAARADLFAKLGVPSRALLLWAEVAAAPDAAPDALLAAAAFLARQGDLAAAKAAVARARRGGADAARVAELDTILAARAALPAR